MLTHSYTDLTENLLDILKKREKNFHCRTNCPVEELFHRVYELEPRLVGTLANIEYSCNRIPHQPEIEYKFRFIYSTDVPHELEQIFVDDGNWNIDPTVMFLGDLPPKLYIVTENPKSLCARIEEEQLFFEYYPGLAIVKTRTCSQSMYGKYTLAIVEADMCVENTEYVRLQMLARKKAAEIIENKLGGKKVNVPNGAKAFLAFNYLQQNVSYDYKAAENKYAKHTNPMAILPYGPLVERSGICAGISAAYKVLMDIYGIPCRIVRGELTVDGSTEAHAWNMIQLGDLWYHVDPTANVSTDEGVYTGAFLRTDKAFSKKYKWDSARWPKCNSSLWNYDRIAELMVEKKYLFGGVGSCYTNPRRIE